MREYDINLYTDEEGCCEVQPVIADNMLINAEIGIVSFYSTKSIFDVTTVALVKLADVKSITSRDHQPEVFIPINKLAKALKK